MLELYYHRPLCASTKKKEKPLPTWQKYILQYWLKNKYFKIMQTSATPALWLHAYGLFTIWKIHYFVILSSFFSPWNVFAPSSTSTFRHPDRANTLQTWPGRLKLLKTCHTNGKTKSKSKTKIHKQKQERSSGRWYNTSRSDVFGGGGTLLSHDSTLRLTIL